ncbi:hypothetical protein DB771_13925 [Burkholderia sp. AU29985]|nr:hypothetical protein XM57_01795 [Burkholderia cepacia]AYZ95770.1 hypothetical protein EGY28_11370 [Burkholderia dolosa]ETP61566.1 hypothetical protein BDSB_27885 [Burkholderia dolosa PC543]PRE52002.1 hypothetical protein C6P87_09870 [Burkholderia sp. AU12872]PUA76305.1 hypothetical protein DB771_13925 [Burkholderia sp. AU29985]
MWDAGRGGGAPFGRRRIPATQTRAVEWLVTALPSGRSSNAWRRSSNAWRRSAALRASVVAAPLRRCQA